MLTSFIFLQNFWLKIAFSSIFAFIISFLGIKRFIKFAHDNPKFFQPIRTDGPQTHQLKKKTPTMGGIFIVLATVISSLLFADLKNPYIIATLFVFLSFAGIGFVDDYLKVFHQNTQGFKGSYKLVLQFLIVGSTFLYLASISYFHMKGSILLPFGHGYWITLSTVFYVIFVTFVIVGSSNAVNLTDGLDGLVSVPAIICIFCLSVMIYVASSIHLSSKFMVPDVENCQELLIFCASLASAIAAFLCFNVKPAKIFMGDVGSLAIGSSLGIMAVIIKAEFVFFVTALLFVIEASSVILQVGSYKLRKKRIFLMAPIHHHFEKLGWSEKKVVRVFWASSAFFGALGMLIYFS